MCVFSLLRTVTSLLKPCLTHTLPRYRYEHLSKHKEDDAEVTVAALLSLLQLNPASEHATGLLEFARLGACEGHVRRRTADFILDVHFASIVY